MNRRHLVIPICFLLSIWWFSPAAGAFRYLREGMESPPVVLDGFDSDRDAKGRILIVIFWASWSERSMRELQDMQPFYELYSDSGLQVVAVNVDREQMSEAESDSVRSLVQTLGITFPAVVDEDLATFNTYGVIAVPSTALVDSAGVLRYGPAGYSLGTRDRLFDSAIALLGGEPREAATPMLAYAYQPDKRALRYYNLGLNLYLKGAIEQARKNLRKSVELDTTFSQSLSLLGATWLYDEEYDSAGVYLERAIRCDSTNLSVLAGCARLALKTGDTARAEQLVGTALAIDSVYTPVRLIGGQIKLKRAFPDSAMAVLEECLTYDQRNPVVFYLIGKARKAMGKPAEASTAFLTAYGLLVE